MVRRYDNVRAALVMALGRKWLILIDQISEIGKRLVDIVGQRGHSIVLEELHVHADLMPLSTHCSQWKLQCVGSMRVLSELGSWCHRV